MLKLASTDDGLYHYTKLADVPDVYTKLSLPDNAIIAGGYAMHLLNNNLDYRDVDIWLPNSCAYSAIGDLEYESEWAMSYCTMDMSTPKDYGFISSYDLIRYQVMRKHYDNPLSLLKDFDMTICRVAVQGIDVIFHTDFYNAVVYNIVHSSADQPNIRRMWKYANKFGTSVYKMFDAYALLEFGITEQTTDKEIWRMCQRNREEYGTNIRLGAII